MTIRQMRLYDIPDEHQLIHQYLDEIQKTHSTLSPHLVLDHLKDVANEGRFVTGCKPLLEGLWALDVSIGFGDTARILFFETPRGDYLALHGFTVCSGSDADRGLSVAADRKRGLM
jgi:hypothetical protein